MLEVLRDGEKDLTGNIVREMDMITALGAEQRDKELQAEDAAVSQNEAGAGACIRTGRFGSLQRRCLLKGSYRHIGNGPQSGRERRC